MLFYVHEGTRVIFALSGIQMEQSLMENICDALREDQGKQTQG